LILIADYAIVSRIHVDPIEWNSFLPKSPAVHDRDTVLDGHQQYLFSAISSKNILKELKKQSIIDRYIPLEEYPNTYLLIFDSSKLNTVLELTKEYPRSGTSIVGNILFKNFFQELGFYTLVIFPFVLMILLLFIPLRLWIDIVMEMGLYLMALSLILNCGFFQINSASLLALIFLVIYALTLFNYIYAEGMNRRRLFFGIQISVAAAMLSAVFLVTSHFGLIHSFGVMMMVGLGILHLYMNIRIYLMKYFPYKPYRNSFILRSTHSLWKISKKYLMIVIPGTMIGVLALSYHPLNIDLNIVNLLPHSSIELKRINQFEEDRLPTLPFVISVRSKNNTFADENMMRELIEFQRELEPLIPGKIVVSAPKAFNEFTNLAPDKNNPNLLPQFLLAESFSTHPLALWSADRMQSNIVASIGLTTTTNTMRTMLYHIKELSEHYPDFTVTVSGKISDFDYFINIFVEEFLIGLIATLIATAFFFWYYCRNVMSVLTIMFSALFSLGILGIFHIIFDKPITILTLLNVILYAGLIADSLIQLFVCYKREGESCERSVLQPIFISNFSILICLAGMFFVGGMMRAFAFELGILLTANLIFILLIVPKIQRHYFTTCSE
jgi:hypothetical protein